MPNGDIRSIRNIYDIIHIEGNCSVDSSNADGAFIYDEKLFNALKLKKCEEK
jgi:hypothetical protein